jgi:hypothetical protein
MMPALLSSVVLLMACATPPVKIQTTEAACSVLKPLPYHYDAAYPNDTVKNEIDTPETAKTIQAHNARLEALCKEK